MKTMKYEIKSRWDSKILFTADVASFALAVVTAIKSGANLSGANLHSANLYSANLYSANLRSANLYSANLYSANLRSAKDISVLADAQSSIIADGNIVGWKKCLNNVIVKLLIPQKAKRSNATGRKCRAEFVQVLRVFGANEGISQHDNKTVYRKGET